MPPSARRPGQKLDKERKQRGSKEGRGCGQEGGYYLLVYTRRPIRELAADEGQ